MKQKLKIIVGVVVFGIVGNVLAQPATGENTDTQGGRYRLTVVNEGTYSTPYVIDTQTGRVWRQAVDSESKMFVFVSMNYRNIDGELSKIPNEIATGVVLKNKAAQDAVLSSNSTGTSQSTDSSADADLQFWQQQLANIKAGKEWRGSPNGSPQPPSDSAAETAQWHINQAQKNKQQ